MSHFSFSTRDERNSLINRKQDLMDENAHEKYALNHAFPELFPPVKIPDPFPVPSHVTVEAFTKTLKADNQGRFLIYFSPLTCAWESIR